MALAARESKDLPLFVEFDCSLNRAHEISHCVTNLLTIVTETHWVEFVEGLPATDAVVLVCLIGELNVSLFVRCGASVTIKIY